MGFMESGVLVRVGTPRDSGSWQCISRCWMNLFISFADQDMPESGNLFFIMSICKVVASQSVIRWCKVLFACVHSGMLDQSQGFFLDRK